MVREWVLTHPTPTPHTSDFKCGGSKKFVFTSSSPLLKKNLDF